MATYTARGLSTNALQQGIHQVTHTFGTGTVLAFDGTNYIRALADNPTDAETIGIVALVLSADDFVLSQEGHISNITYGAPFVPGTRYFLSSAVPGQLTATPPTTAGEVLLALFDADSTTSGYYMNNPGEVIGSDGDFPTVITVADTPMISNTRYINRDTVNAVYDLPLVSVVGDRLIIDNDAAGAPGFNELLISQGAGQYIRMGTVESTPGVTGGANSTNRGDSATLVCIEDNLGWFLEASAGSAWNLI